jgi:hypothetical protein
MSNEIRVRCYEFGAQGFTRAYHSELSLNGGAFVAFNTPGKVMQVGVFGEMVHEFTHRFDHANASARFDELRTAWDTTKYDLLSRNCNHFVDAVLEAFGHSGLPKQYFSSGDQWHRVATNTLSVMGSPIGVVGGLLSKHAEDREEALKDAAKGSMLIPGGPLLRRIFKW